MAEDQNANRSKVEQTEEERLREIREGRGELFVIKTIPGGGIAIIGGVRYTPRAQEKNKS